MKKCTICKEDLDESKFNKDKTRSDGLDCSCRDCKSKRKKKEYWNNREEYLIKCKEYDAKRYGTEKHNAKAREYRANNRDKHRKWCMDYKAAKLKATLPGFDAEILCFYTDAVHKSLALGVPYEVDHIIPLNPRSKTVCGLHVPWNLQVITKEENVKKSDKSLVKSL